VSVSSGLYEGAPLMSEQAMYIPAAASECGYLSLVHVWFNRAGVVRRQAREGLTLEIQRALAVLIPTCRLRFTA